MSETRKFQRNRARVVITFDIEVSDTYLRTIPAYKRNAMSVLRDLFADRGSITLGELVTRLRRQSTRYSIISEKVEIAS